MHYLYLLKFNDKRFFKIGISSFNLNRIHTHDKTYSIDTENSLIFKGEAQNIKAIERLILAVVPSCKVPNSNYQGLDGYTEIRGIDKFDPTMEIISANQSVLNLTKHFLKDEIEKKCPITVQGTMIKEVKLKLRCENTSNISKRDNLLNLIIFIKELNKLMQITDSIEVIIYNNVEMFKFKMLESKNSSLIDYDNLHQTIKLSMPKHSTSRRYGAETAAGSYEKNIFQITEYVIMHLPDMQEYDFKDYNEYCPVFDKQYSILRQYVFNLKYDSFLNGKKGLNLNYANI